MQRDLSTAEYVARSLMICSRAFVRVQAPLHVLIGRASAQQAHHHAGGGLAGFLNVDSRHLSPPLRIDRGDALTRFGRIRAGAEILQIRTVGRRGAGLLGIRPGLVVRGLACLRLERGRALARLGHVRAGSEILDIAVEGRGGVRAVASVQAFSSASLRACSSSAAMRARASAACPPDA